MTNVFSSLAFCLFLFCAQLTFLRTGSELLSKSAASQAIGNKDVTGIYLGPKCMFSKNVLNIIKPEALDALNIPVRYVKGPDGRDTQHIKDLQKRTNRRTVPALEIDGKDFLFESSDIIDILKEYQKLRGPQRRGL